AICKVKGPRARQLEKVLNLAREMIGNADAFRLLVDQLGVGRDFEGVPGEADERRASESRERLHCLSHGERETHQFEGDIHSASVCLFAKLLDRILVGSVYRGGAEARRELQLPRVNVHREYLRGPGITRQLDRGNAETSCSENRNGFTRPQPRLLQRVQ